MADTAFEERLRADLHDAFFVSAPKLTPDAPVEEVQVWGTYPDLAVAIVFRENRRPQCRFGFNWGSIRPFLEDPTRDPGEGELRSVATNVWANWEELLVSGDLPEHCDPEEITWYPVSPAEVPFRDGEMSAPPSPNASS